MRTRFAEIPFHPLVFAAAYVVNSAVAAGIHPSAGGRALLVAVGGAATITIAMSLATRNRHVGAAIATSVLAAMVLAQAARIGFQVASRMAPWQSIIWLALIAATLFLCFRLVRRTIAGTSPRGLSRGLNVLSLILAGVVVSTAFLSSEAGPAISELVEGRSPARAGVVANPEASPDIIVVLLDGYPRADTLERIFDYDNTPFLDDLRDRGFFVADRARSNYTWTQLTLASMFHMRHLEDIPEYQAVASREVPERRGVREVLNTPPAIEHLSRLGYETYAVPPGIDWVTLRSVDHVMDSGTVSEFEYHLLRATGMDVVLSVLAPDFIGGQHRDRILTAFESIEAAAAGGPRPRFMFGHLLSPHMPAVFHRDGSFRRPSLSDNIFADLRLDTDIASDDWVAMYTDQLTYLNSRLLQMVDTVAAANPDAVIVLMSDHGSGVDWYWSTAAHSDERTATLFAARTPGESNVFQPDQTPVNLFPMLLNSYFASELPIHPDRVFLGSLDLVEITNPDDRAE